jgi:dihydrofolate reductase
MQELLVDFITSLDGYGAAEGWPGWWGLEGPEYLAWLGQQPERDYTILMGANTYRLMSGFATESKASASDEPMSDEGAAIAELAAAPKVVFSSTLKPPLSWPNTRLITGDAVEAVATMKQDDTSPMRTLGSLTLCRSLLGAGLVDRFRVVVFPVITGSTGRDRIYDGYPMSTSRWLPAERSTADSSCSSTSPRCSPAHPASTPLPERPLLSRVVPVRTCRWTSCPQRWSQGSGEFAPAPGDPDGHLGQVSLAGTATDRRAGVLRGSPAGWCRATSCSRCRHFRGRSEGSRTDDRR